VIADALVSTGLAKLGYKYVNIGMSPVLGPLFAATRLVIYA